MVIDTMVWNLDGGFSKESSARSLLTDIAIARPHIAVFPDAYCEGKEHFLDYVDDEFDRAGYRVTRGLSEEGQPVNHGLVSIVDKRMSLSNKPGELVRLASRNIIRQWLFDPLSGERFTLFGVRLNKYSTVLRHFETEELLELVPAHCPTIIAGTMDALHKEAVIHKKILYAHVINALVEKGLLPAKQPDPALGKFSLSRLGGLARRLHEMADGKIMELFHTNDYVDADFWHQSTEPARKPFMQTDHIMTTMHFQVSDFTVLPAKGSNHLGIMGGLSLIPPRINE